MMGKGSRQAVIWILLLIAFIALMVHLLSPSGGPAEIPLKGPEESVVGLAREGKIIEITQKGAELEIKAVSEEGATAKYKSAVLEGEDIRNVLKEEGVPEEILSRITINYRSARSFWDSWGGLLVNLIPVLLLGLLLFFLFRQAQGGTSQAFSFGRSRPKVIMGNRPNVTFKDVAGVEEAKQELWEVVEFLKNPQKFAALGARVPKGVLLVGPAGCGKTLLSKAVAGEAGVPFFAISGSEFVEMFVGVGAARVRDLFEQAKRNAPSIIFIDEIDAVGRHRGAGIGGGHDEREQTLNQILVEMDGFDTNTNVVVIAATNRPDILDPALLRPGRFDRRVVVDLPDVKGRLEILKIHTKNKPLDPSVDLEVIARQTPGFSGADLANLANEAAILAARRNKDRITMKEFEDAIDKVLAGPERKSKIISEKEKRIKAYHEAGHALVAFYHPDADPVHRISIISRGLLGGYTRMVPQEDRSLWTRSQLEAMLAVALGGYTAEEIAFGEVSTGSENDLERATDLARKMVVEYGMSPKLGPRIYGKREGLVFLGKDIVEERNYSEKAAQEIDEEIKRIIEEAHQRARRILTEHREKLDRLAEELIRKETLEESEIKAILEPPSPAS